MTRVTKNRDSSHAITESQTTAITFLNYVMQQSKVHFKHDNFDMGFVQS